MLFAALVLAGSELSGAEENATDDTLVELEASSAVVHHAALSPAGGSIASDATELDLSVPLAGSKELGLGLDLSARHTHFRIHAFDQFLAGTDAPLSEGNEIVAQPIFVYSPTHDVTWVAVVGGQYAAARRTSLDDGLLANGSIAVTRRFSPTLLLGVGVEAEQWFHRSALVVPFPLVEWQITDRWSLLSMDGQSGELRWKLNSRIAVLGQLVFEEHEFRLAGNSSIPSGVLHTASFPMSLGVEYKPAPRVGIALRIGRALGQQFTWYNSRGDKLRDSATHAPWILSLGVDAKF